MEILEIPISKISYCNPVSDEDIKTMCADTVKWIEGVNGDNIYYTMLFLMGVTTTIDSVEKYFKHKKLIINFTAKNLSQKCKLLFRARREVAQKRSIHDSM